MLAPLRHLFRPDFLPRHVTPTARGLWRYWFGWMTLLSLVFSGMLAWSWQYEALPEIRQALSEFEEGNADVLAYSLTVTDGQLTTTLPQPFVLAVGEESGMVVTPASPTPLAEQLAPLADGPAPDLLLVVDPTADFATPDEDAPALPAATTQVLLGGAAGVIVHSERDGHRETQLVPYSELPDGTLDYPTVKSWAQTAIAYAGPAIAVGVFVGVFFYYALLRIVFWAFLTSLVLWVVARLWGKAVTYGQTYTAVLFYTVPQTVVSLLLWWGGVWVPLHGFVLMATLWVWHLWGWEAGGEAGEEVEMR